MMYDGVIEKPSIDDLFDESCFAHYGVQGMKWGVRKAVDRIDSYRKNIAKKINMNRLSRSSYAYNNYRKNKSYTKVRRAVLKAYGSPRTGNAKADLLKSTSDQFMEGILGSNYSKASKMAKLGNTFYGTVGNQKIKKIASYNSLSSKAKRGFDSFKNITLKKSKKVKLSSLTNGNKNSAMNSLLTSSSAARDAAAVVKGSKSFLRNTTKGLRGLKSVSSKIPYADHRTGLPVNEAALKGVDDYTLSLLKKNAKRLAGW